jgi:hypothetical protein
MELYGGFLATTISPELTKKITVYVQTSEILKFYDGVA